MSIVPCSDAQTNFISIAREKTFTTSLVQHETTSNLIGYFVENRNSKRASMVRFILKIIAS